MLEFTLPSIANSVFPILSILQAHRYTHMVLGSARWQLLAVKLSLLSSIK